MTDKPIRPDDTSTHPLSEMPSLKDQLRAAIQMNISDARRNGLSYGDISEVLMRHWGAIREDLQRESKNVPRVAYLKLAASRVPWR